MRRILLISLGLLISHGALADSSLWTDLNSSQNGLSARGDLSSDRYNSRQLSLEESSLQQILDNAPLEDLTLAESNLAQRVSAVTMSLPLPTGESVLVEVVESPIMEAGLAEKYPDLKTWSVKGVDNDVLSGRLDFTNKGFHAVLSMADGDTIYIEPEDLDSGRLYHSLSRNDNMHKSEGFHCGVEGHDHSKDVLPSDLAARVAQSVGSSIKELRLAVASAPAFTTAVGGTTSDAMGAITTVVNRVNEIYQRDVGVRFKLVTENDKLLFGGNSAFTPNTAYNPNNLGSMLTANQANVEAVIGTNNYDIGHVFSHTGTNSSAGLAAFQSACSGPSTTPASVNQKAQGVSGYMQFLDTFASDMFAHELGHQLGASHTFNSTANACSTREGDTSYEPGGGTTIMGYAGVCGADNVQNNADPFFHGGSIKQMIEFAASRACGTEIVSGNTAPEVEAGLAKTIPAKTPFELTGSATDADATDSLTFSWEQFNASASSQSLSAGDIGTNAIIRSLPPVSSPTRSIPNLQSLYSGVAAPGEIVPQVARDPLKMILTARDQKAGVDIDDVDITVTDTGAAFAVTGPSGTMTANSAQTVTWNVAGTSAAPISCANVDISLLVGDPTYGDALVETSLVTGVANNGSASVTLPAAQAATSRARFKVKCSDNLFYAVSAANLGITSAPDAGNTTSTFTISDFEAEEGDSGVSHIKFTVNISPVLTAPTNLFYGITLQGTTSESDFIISGSSPFGLGVVGRQIAAGVPSVDFYLRLTTDTVIEPNETFLVQLYDPAINPHPNASAIGTIIDDDTPPVTASVAANSKAEGDSGSSNATFTVTLDGAQTSDVTVDYSTSDVTAVEGTDYTAANGTLSFPAGTTSQTFTVPVLGDEIYEGDETFNVNLLNPSKGVKFAADASTVSALGTITEDDSVPTLSISNASVAEGDTGDTNAMTFTVTLSGETQSNVTVQYATSDGTGVAGTDYTPVSGATLTIAAGQTSNTLTVNAIGDDVSDGDKTFNVLLTSPTVATVLDGTGVGTVQDDEIPPVQATIADVSVNELDAGTVTAGFVVTLSAAQTVAVTVDYTTENDSATSGSDYTATSGTLTFPIGTTSLPIDVVVASDLVYEGNEEYKVTLSNPSVGLEFAAGATSISAEGTIVDNESVPTLSIDDQSVPEGNAGATPALTFTVSLSGLSQSDVTVQYATSDGSGVAGTDYTAVAATELTIPAGQTSNTLTVNAIGNDIADGNKTFNVLLTSPSGATVLDGTGVGTVQDDEIITASIAAATIAEGNAGGTNTLDFVVTLSAAATGPMSVTYNTSDGTAVAASDYTAVSGGTVDFIAGDTSKTISVNVTGDTAPEDNEAMTVTLSNPTPAADLAVSSTDGSATGTITNDDPHTTVNASISSPTAANEGNSATSDVTFVVTLDAASTQTVTVDYASANGSADASDFTAVNGTLTFAPGETSKNIVVQVNGDTDFETDESFTVVLSNPTGSVTAPGVAITTDTGTATISNDDNNTVSIADAVVGEGDGTVTLTLTLEGPHADTVTPLTVDYTIATGTAGTADYTPAAGAQTVTFAATTPASTTQTIVVSIVDDALNEGAEAFAINLSNPSTGLTIVDGDATVTINDNDISIVSIASSKTVAESGSATFDVTVSPAATTDVTVNYETAALTATDGSDFTGTTSGSIIISAGDTTGTITVPVAADTTVEADETFTVTLSSVTPASDAQLSATATVLTATITNDDKSQVSVADVTAVEGSDLGFTISLDQPSLTALTVDYATSDGTATTADSDYTASTGTLTFAVGETSKSVTVATTADIVTESNETLTFTLSTPSAELVIADATATGTVNDDDTNSDGDSLSDAQEAIAGTNPQLTDTDGDGTNDAAEVGTDINNPTDTDGDGIIDALENVAAQASASIFSASAAFAQSIGLSGVIGNYEVSAPTNGTAAACPGESPLVSEATAGADNDYDFPNGIVQACITGISATGDEVDVTLQYPASATIAAGSVVRLLNSSGVWITIADAVIDANNQATFKITEGTAADRDATGNTEIKFAAGIAKRSIVTGNASSGGGSMSLLSLMFLSMFALLCVARRRRLATEL